ncbi:MAG: PIG-L family deacetylase [Oscillospiraceae bacterium]|nr:PIG-L family deacetylase [Oscillospiraceae bacterium]
MNFINKEAQIHVPSGGDTMAAIAATTDICIAAHQDDIEIMAYSAISQCFGKSDRHFTGVTVTDGAGSPRSGIYERYSDEDMKKIRANEQKMAADIGRYCAQLQLAYPSSAVKNPANSALIGELKDIILAASPHTLYTHNLADKHDTHVAVALNVIRALREIPGEKRPKKVITCEVWRSLGWLCDEEKTLLPTDGYPNLSAALLGVYDSQISGGKRYDLATQGRRLSNATFFASHEVDAVESLAFGLDITELVNSDLDPAEFISKHIDSFKNEVITRIGGLS